MPLQQNYLGKFIGYFTTETATSTRWFSCGGTRASTTRAARRERIAKDPAWQAYLKKVQPLIMMQENRILKPTPFSPIR